MLLQNPRTGYCTADKEAKNIIHQLETDEVLDSVWKPTEFE